MGNLVRIRPDAKLHAQFQEHIGSELVSAVDEGPNRPLQVGALLSVNAQLMPTARHLLTRWPGLITDRGLE